MIIIQLPTWLTVGPVKFVITELYCCPQVFQIEVQGYFIVNLKVC